MSSDSKISLDLESYVVSKAPSKVYYIPEFISDHEETAVMKHVQEAPIPKWTHLTHRRLQNWGGIPHPKGMIAESIPSWLQTCIDKVIDTHAFDSATQPNHVLVNEYVPGQGIMPHLDGPLFSPTISTISIGSHTVLNFYEPLNDTTTSAEVPTTSSNIDSVPKPDEVPWKTWNERKAFTLLLEPRSLVILKEKAYCYYLHGIEEITEDTMDSKIVNLDTVPSTSIGEVRERSTRVSLTIRHVPKRSKLVLKF